jgi:hypothetical protein
LKPRLRSDAPKLRSAEAFVEKHEQIFDALEHERITPKTAEQMGQQLKGILSIEKMGLQWWGLAFKYGRKVPVPRSPILRSILGLPEEIAPTDGATIRAMLPER